MNKAQNYTLMDRLVNANMHNGFSYYANMNSQKFKPRTLTETLTLLCHARGGDFLLKGKVNQSEIGRHAGTSQSNISRWYSGETEPRDEHVRALAKAFKITPAQMRGENPINALDGYVAKSPEDDEFLEDFIHLPESMKHQIREQVKFYKELNDQNQNQKQQT